MRERILAATKAAMKGGDKERLVTLRLISAAIKDRDIAARVDAKGVATGIEQVADGEILQELTKMAKQRRESLAIYQDAGRADLVDKEKSVLAVIEEFLPQQMDEAAMTAAIQQVITETGASEVKDMGKVMGALKTKYAGEMDFGRASALVKAALTG